MFIEQHLLKLFVNLTVISSKIPLNRFYLPIPNLILVIGYYALVSILIIKYKTNRYTILKCILNIQYLKRKIIKYKDILKKIFVIFFVVIFIFYLIKVVPKTFRINFLDVGQGDCTLVRTKYNKVILNKRYYVN